MTGQREHPGLPAHDDVHGTDADLAARARSGDTLALGRLYDRFYPAVFRYALARLGSGADAEDVAEETFLKVVRAIDRYEPRGGVPFSAWLFRIARNELVSFLRRRSAGVVTEPLGDEAAPAEGDLVADLDRKLLLERTWRAVEQLPDAQRQVVALRFGAGLSVMETAKALGKREGNVRVLQHHALAKLRTMLAGEQP